MRNIDSGAGSPVTGSVMTALSRAAFAIPPRPAQQTEYRCFLEAAVIRHPDARTTAAA
jgi:hypothetical protein